MKVYVQYMYKGYAQYMKNKHTQAVLYKCCFMNANDPILSNGWLSPQVGPHTVYVFLDNQCRAYTNAHLQSGYVRKSHGS